MQLVYEETQDLCEGRNVFVCKILHVTLGFHLSQCSPAHLYNDCRRHAQRENIRQFKE